MGSIPVANPAPYQRPHLSRRGLLVLALPLALIALIVMVVAFAWPTGPEVESARWVEAGTVDALAVNEPVRNVEGRFWLVKLESGEIIALSQRSTYDLRPCTVPWRPDFEFQGRRGWFRDPCSGTTWNIDGQIMFGPAPRNMDRYWVDIRDDEIFVDISRRLCAPGEVRGGVDICLGPLPSPGAVPG